MKRNPVQFRKGLSLNEFLEHYGDEDKCHDALFRLRVPTLRLRQELSPEHPQAAPVLPLQPAGPGHRRDHLRVRQAAADPLAPGDLPADPDQKGGIVDAAAPPAGGVLQCRLAHQAQADAGDGRAYRKPAS